jgi:hypothetical protein
MRTDICPAVSVQYFRTSELPSDGASTIMADQTRWISRLVVQSVRIVGSLSSGSGMRLSNLDGRGGFAPVAATKLVGLDQIREGITAGLTILGENRLQ